jgi:uncharacterized protein with GYD domain
MATAKKPSKLAAKSNQQYYLIQYSYTSTAWDDLLKNPGKRDRVAAVKPIVAALGGCIATITFECDYNPNPTEKFVSFGDHDVVALIAFPSDDAAAAFAMIVSAGGGVKSMKTTRIMPWEQAMGAMGTARSIQERYAPPGKGR